MKTIVLEQTKKQHKQLETLYSEVFFNDHYSRLIMGQFWENSQIKVSCFTCWEMLRYSFILCLYRIRRLITHEWKFDSIIKETDTK